MTGYRSCYFRHDCVKKGCYIDQLPCWDDLIDECFPRGIRPTDIDGMVEINGQILIMEEKCAGKGPDEGQRRALKELASKDGVTVVYFRPHGIEMQMLVVGMGEPKGWQTVTRDQLKSWLRWWASTADGHTPAA